MKQFDLQFETDKPAIQLRREMLSEWTAELAGEGYELTSQSDVGVTFHRKYRPWYTIVGAIFLFPIGLLFLLITEDAAITATVDRAANADRTVLRIRGEAPANVRRGFEDLEV